MTLSRDRGRAKLVMTVVSFGYKYGLAGRCRSGVRRALPPNPYFVPGLRRRTGPRRAVPRSWSATSPRVDSWIRLEEYVKFVVPYYIAEERAI